MNCPVCNGEYELYCKVCFDEYHFQSGDARDSYALAEFATDIKERFDISNPQTKEELEELYKKLEKEVESMKLEEEIIRKKRTNLDNYLGRIHEYLYPYLWE